jgi:hypothetical protein
LPRVHSLVFDPLQSPFVLAPSLHPKVMRRPARVRSLIAASSRPVHSVRRFPTSATCRPQVFATSRRFPPAPDLRVYFAPLPRPGCIPSRGFSLRAATLPHRQEIPPFRSMSTTPHPKVESTVDLAGFEVFLRAEMRSRSVRCLAGPFGRSPPRVLLLQVLLPSPWSPVSRVPSAPGVHSSGLRLRARRTSSSSASLPRRA